MIRFDTIRVRLSEWLLRFCLVGGAQLVIQGLSFASGILILRLLSVKEYAIYTLATAVLATMNTLGDGGLANAIMAQGGPIWRDRQKLGSVLKTGLMLRGRYFGWIAAVSSIVLGFLLYKHHVNPIETLILILLVVVIFWQWALADMYSIGPNLAQYVGPTQRISVIQAVARLGLLIFVLPLLRSATVAIGLALASQIIAVRLLRRLSTGLADFNQPPNREVREGAAVVVRDVLPTLIYYSLSGYLTIWLLSLFGRTAAIASMGALTRLGQIFSIISGVASATVIPRFARLKDESEVIRRRFLQCLVVGILGCSTLVIIVSAIPQEIVWILGYRYRILSSEVRIYMSGSVLYWLGGIIFSLGNARGIVPNRWLSVSSQIAVQAVALYAFGMSTVHDMVKVSLVTGAAQLVIFTGSILYRLNKKCLEQRWPVKPLIEAL